MEWFQGAIPSAIGAARERKSIFAVVVTDGDDDNSKKLLASMNEPRVAMLFKNCVAISIKNGSQEAQQFSQLCNLFCLESLKIFNSYQCDDVDCNQYAL